MKILCINLDERTDRLEHFKKEFFFNMPYEEFIRISAIRHSIGAMGCKLTYLSIFKEFINEKQLMIFEDDALFLSGARSIISAAIRQLPASWDMLYLGGNPQQPLKRYSDNLFWAENIFCTHAILYNNQHGLFDYILSYQQVINKIDVFFARDIPHHFDCFITWPMAVTQWDNPSDICKNSDYSMLLKNYKLYTNE